MVSDVVTGGEGYATLVSDPADDGSKVQSFYRRKQVIEREAHTCAVNIEKYMSM